MNPRSTDEQDRAIRADLDSILRESRRLRVRGLVLAVGGLFAGSWFAVSLFAADGIQFKNGTIRVFWHTDTTLGMEMNLALFAIAIFVLIGLAVTRRRET